MKKILQFFHRNQVTALFVGGAVRDLLVGKNPKDIDVVALTSPERLEQLGGVPVDPKTGIPVYIFHIEKHRVEVALPRRERKTGAGYKGFVFETGPDVSLEEDLFRRDFTINALAMSVDGKVIDPFGGINDLENRVLRAVNPEAFKDDPLRVIRAARFVTKGFRIEPVTLKLMQAVTVEEFQALPVERFTEELLKALHEPYPEKFIEILRMVPEACEVFFPELLKTQEIPVGPQKHHPEGNLFNHIVQVMSRCATPESRFAGLMHDMGKILTPATEWPRHYNHDVVGEPLVREICQRLRIPAKLRNIAVFCAREHMRAASPLRDGKLIMLAEKSLRVGAAKALVELCSADGTSEETISRLKKAIEIVSIPASKLNVEITGSPFNIRERIFHKRIHFLQHFTSHIIQMQHRR